MKACDVVEEQKIVEKNSWPHYDMYKYEIKLAIKDYLYLKIIHADVLSRGWTIEYIYLHNNLIF